MLEYIWIVLPNLSRFGEYGSVSEIVSPKIVRLVFVVVVSENMGLYYKLDKSIDCNRLCKEIGKYVEEFRKNNGEISDKVLSISISSIIHNSTEHIPKLENNQK